MACPAINGYHSVATYSWQRNGNPIVGEETPLLFCAEIGVFRCYVNAGSNTTLTSPEFVVSGRFALVKAAYMYLFTLD